MEFGRRALHRLRHFSLSHFTVRQTRSRHIRWCRVRLCHYALSHSRLGHSRCCHRSPRFGRDPDPLLRPLHRWCQGSRQGRHRGRGRGRVVRRLCRSRLRGRHNLRNLRRLHRRRTSRTSRPSRASRPSRTHHPRPQAPPPRHRRPSEGQLDPLHDTVDHARRLLRPHPVSQRRQVSRRAPRRQRRREPLHRVHQRVIRHHPLDRCQPTPLPPPHGRRFRLGGTRTRTGTGTRRVTSPRPHRTITVPG